MQKYKKFLNRQVLTRNFFVLGGLRAFRYTPRCKTFSTRCFPVAPKVAPSSPVSIGFAPAGYHFNPYRGFGFHSYLSRGFQTVSRNFNSKNFPLFNIFWNTKTKYLWSLKNHTMKKYISLFILLGFATVALAQNSTVFHHKLKVTVNPETSVITVNDVVARVLNKNWVFRCRTFPVCHSVNYPKICIF